MENRYDNTELLKATMHSVYAFTTKYMKLLLSTHYIYLSHYNYISIYVLVHAATLLGVDYGISLVSFTACSFRGIVADTLGVVLHLVQYFLFCRVINVKINFSIFHDIDNTLIYSHGQNIFHFPLITQFNYTV